MDKREAIRVHRPTQQAVQPKVGKGRGGGKRSLKFDGSSAVKPCFDRELFDDLVNKLDKQIRNCTLHFYKNLLVKIKEFVSAERNEELVPTLFLYGRCVVDLSDLFGEIERTKGLEVRHFDSNTVIDGLADLDENESKTLLFLRLSFSSSEDLSLFDRLISQLIHMKNVYLLVYSSASFSASFERISRITFTKLAVSSAVLGSAVDFERVLFEEFIPAGILESRVCFNGRILIRAHRAFLVESHSVTALRKHLVLLLLEYCKTRRLDDKDFPIVSRTKQYRRILEVFYSFIKSGNPTEETTSMFLLSCKIQSGEQSFEEFYEKQKAIWRKWSKVSWIDGLQRFDRSIRYQDAPLPFIRAFIAEYIETCKDLMEKVKNFVDENDEPVNQAKDQKQIPLQKNATCRWPVEDGRPNVMRRSNAPKSSSFLKNQQTKRSTLIKQSTLPATLVAEAIEFLDKVFLTTLKKFPADFVASVADDSLLAAAFTAEIDTQLFRDIQTAIDGRQLDVCNLYQMIIDFSRESYNIQLAALSDAFTSLLHVTEAERARKPNRGDRTPKKNEVVDAPSLNARFFAALAQLELIGVIRLVSDGVLRLNYLPSSAISAPVDS